MKKIALLLFIIFASVQLAPAVMAVFIETTSVFIADEEKGKNTDSNEKKDFEAFSDQSVKLTLTLNLAVQLTERIQPSLRPDKLTPPPDFC